MGKSYSSVALAPQSVGKDLGSSSAGPSLAPRAGAAQGSPVLLPTCVPRYWAQGCTLTSSATLQGFGAAKVDLRSGDGAGAGAAGRLRRPGGGEWGAGWSRGRRAVALQDLGRCPRAGPKHRRVDTRTDARGAPPPLTLLSSCLHLFFPSTLLSHLASLTFALLPLLSAVSSLLSTDAWTRTWEGKSPVSLI